MPISIEFKSDTVNIVEAKLKSGVFEVQHAITVSFPEEWLDVKGIREIGDFYLLLSQVFDDYKFKTKDVAICLNNTSIIYRELIVPSIDKKKMAMVVRSEMMDVLNLTPDYIMDYVVIEPIVDEEGKAMVRVLAVASLATALESYIELIKLLKLKLNSIDSATNAMIKLVDAIPEMKSLEQFVLVDVGANYLRLYLFEEGKYVLSRNVKLVRLNDSTEDEIINVVEDNINKMIQFSYTRGAKTGINKIILAGRDQLLDELKSKVLEDLLVPCEIFSQPLFINSSDKFETCYINAFGALIRK